MALTPTTLQGTSNTRWRPGPLCATPHTAQTPGSVGQSVLQKSQSRASLPGPKTRCTVSSSHQLPVVGEEVSGTRRVGETGRKTLHCKTEKPADYQQQRRTTRGLAPPFPRPSRPIRALHPRGCRDWGVEGVYRWACDGSGPIRAHHSTSAGVTGSPRSFPLDLPLRRFPPLSSCLLWKPETGATQQQVVLIVCAESSLKNSLEPYNYPPEGSPTSRLFSDLSQLIPFAKATWVCFFVISNPKSPN